MSVCAHTNIDRKRNVENAKTKLLIYAHTQTKHMRPRPPAATTQNQTSKFCQNQ